MSTALGISPAVMINRMVDQSGTTQNASLVKVAELRMQLMTAMSDEQAEAEAISATGTAPSLPLSSGAVVDRLI